MEFKRLRSWVLAGLGVCCLFILLVCLILSSREPAKPGTTTVDQELPQPSVAGRTDEPEAPDAGREHLLEPGEISPAASTVEDLMSKGFPLVSRARRAVVEATASQSIEESVMDLGDLYTIGMSSIHVSTGNYALKDIGRWQAMTRHVKLLRVIEEGRRKPKRISTLLDAEIRRSLDNLEQLEADALFEMANMAKGESTAVVRDDDEFYRTKHRYENAALEFERRHESAYAAFYALANTGQLKSPDLLAQWIEVRRSPMATAKDMNVWLIHQYFQQGGSQHLAEASKHKALAAGASLSSDTVKRSRWNGLWDVDHALLRVKKVDVSGIPTIGVLKVPMKLDIDETTKDAIIANFLAHARRLDQR